ncbi:MAG: hypothetical protein H7068_12220 [Pedobacter sp.]|nr:hypothetical protein [Chitinophagaceae bacterium]
MLLLIVLFFTVTQIYAQQKLTLLFKNKVGNEVLVLGKSYKNPFGEDIIINKFKYYISNILLVDDKGKSTSIAKNFFLIDEADSASKTIQLLVNFSQIKEIYFLLGVDSIRNISGVQTGALDPMNGMFWTWNSGYIMAKLEGVSSVAKVPGNLFSQHIGGFKNGENAAREIKLTVDSWRLTGGNSITIEANINKWFQSISLIKISEHPICHSPGELAMKFADNYATMFSISSTN